MPSTKHVTLTWTGGLAFEGGAPNGPPVTLDGDGARGPSPMDAMLLSLAGCSAIDVVLILQKMREPLDGLRVEATGERRDAEPKKYTAARLVFHVTGAGLDRGKVERAVALSIERYCSVAASFDPGMRLETAVELG